MKKTLIIALLALVAMAGQAKVKTVVWENPTTEYGTSYRDGFFELSLDVTKVELKETETLVYMTVSQRSDYSKYWYQFSGKTFLKAGNTQYFIISADGTELDKHCQTGKDGKADVVLHFQPLPLNTKVFDFSEGDSKGDWQIKGIKPVSERWKQLFPSYWRDDKGDWKIAFLEDCAIYDCQFWDYRQSNVNPKTGQAEMILTNGKEELKVSIGKDRKGFRTMQIGNRKVVYSMITSRFMPDYPTKDTRTGFVDTHYQTDTVTFIGWLKDMPESMKKKGNEYSISVYDNIFDDNSKNISYGKMDDLGRFVMKIPMLNSSEVFYDWDRTYIRTLFEPGKTYFMLYDFKEGRRYFMGDDCRLQNETLAHPISWGFRYPDERDMDKEKALAFMQGLKENEAEALSQLEKVIAVRPNVSDRYINYLKGHYQMDVCRNLMQGRYFMKHRDVPAEIMDYVNPHWQQLRRPYTLYRDFGTFRRDYIDKFIADRYYIRVGETYTIGTSLLYPVILRKYRDEGKVKITDEELDIVQRYAEGFCKYSCYVTEDEEAKKAHDAFFESDLVKQFSAIYGREDVEKALKEEYPLSFVYFSLSVLDSIDCDQDMRDIIIVNRLSNVLERSREPLSDHIMQFLEENVKMPAAKDYVKAQNEKYLAIQRRDISKSPSLKSAGDVADMSDGEQILRKLIAPYKGKIILLDIWGTWCGPCKEGLKHSQEEYERLKDYDLVYLYLANGSPDETWKNIIKEYEVLGDNVVHYNLPQDQQQAIEHFIGISGYPTYRLIDGDGNVLDVNADPRHDLDGLAKLLDKMNARKD